MFFVVYQNLPDTWSRTYLKEVRVKLGGLYFLIQASNNRTEMVDFPQRYINN